MKLISRITLAGLLFAALAANADQVNLVFSFGASGSMIATNAGFNAGPAPMLEVTDSTRGITKTLAGSWTTSTGPASSVVIMPGQLAATYTAGGADSVLIKDASNNVLLSGITRNDSHFLANQPQGTAAFSADFIVTAVSPTLLAELGLGPAFEPLGTVTATGGSVLISGTDVTAEVGGGSVTIETPAPVAEIKTILLMGSGAVMMFWYVGKRQMS